MCYISLYDTQYCAMSLICKKIFDFFLLVGYDMESVPYHNLDMPMSCPYKIEYFRDMGINILGMLCLFVKYY